MSRQEMTVEEVQKIADDFLDSYNGNITVQVVVRERQEDLYGEQNTVERVGTIYGAYHPKRHIITLAASAFRDKGGASRTIRHELLDHYGLNTFRPDEKADLLHRVLETKNEPTLSHIWQTVNQLYPDRSELHKAEEVFAFVAEDQPTFLQSAWNHVRAAFQRALRTAGLSDRPLTAHELYDTARQVAKGIREGKRQQQNFPATDNALFRHASDKGADQSTGKEEASKTRRNESRDRDFSR